MGRVHSNLSFAHPIYSNVHPFILRLGITYLMSSANASFIILHCLHLILLPLTAVANSTSRYWALNNLAAHPINSNCLFLYAPFILSKYYLILFIVHTLPLLCFKVLNMTLYHLTSF